MPTLFINNHAQLGDNNMDSLALGTIEFYEVGTSTAKAVYSDKDLTVSLGAIVTLDGNGRATIFLSDEDYKVIIKDSDGVVIKSQDGGINLQDDVSSGNFNLIVNNGFEIDSNSNGVPNDWIIVEYPTGVQSLDSSDQDEGSQSIKYVSVGSGGGYNISAAFFSASGGETYSAGFKLKSSVVNVRNLVQVHWYDVNKTSISTSTIYDNSTTNPLVWARKTKSVTAPATARFAKFEMYGCHSSDTTPGITWFDDAVLTTSPLLYAENVFTATNYLTVGSSVAAASTVTLPTDGNIFHLTGTTTVNDFTHITGDGPFYIICDAITPIVHLAGTLELPGKVNFTSAVDDRLVLVQDGTTWMVIDIIRASGNSVSAGKVVQVVNVQTGAVSTSTTILPHDDTIPQNTEGFEVMTLAITPKDTANILIIEVHTIGSPSVASWVSTALFQDTTAGSLAASTAYMTLITGGLTHSFAHKMAAGTTSETTFKIRMGIHDAGTVTFNGSNGARIMGGVAASSITITEYLP